MVANVWVAVPAHVDAGVEQRLVEDAGNDDVYGGERQPCICLSAIEKASTKIWVEHHRAAIDRKDHAGRGTSEPEA